MIASLPPLWTLLALALGIMECDAAVMDGHSRKVGAVLGVRDCIHAVSVARHVMDHSVHNVLCGEGASAYARAIGLSTPGILTPEAADEWRAWRARKEARASAAAAVENKGEAAQEGSHDTVGVVCMDKDGHLAAATSTTGWKFKVAGRVGDSALVGSGLYADDSAGAAVATV